MENCENGCIKEVVLDNHLTVRLLDHSRKISVDAYLVVLVAQMNVPVEKALLMETELATLPLEDVVAVLGDQVCFEHRVERNFIMAEDKDKVLDHLVNTFTENMVGYLSKTDFPGKFIAKKYKDNQGHTGYRH